MKGGCEMQSQPTLGQIQLTANRQTTRSEEKTAKTLTPPHIRGKKLLDEIQFFVFLCIFVLSFVCD